MKVFLFILVVIIASNCISLFNFFSFKLSFTLKFNYRFQYNIFFLYFILHFFIYFTIIIPILKILINLPEYCLFIYNFMTLVY